MSLKNVVVCIPTKGLVDASSWGLRAPSAKALSQLFRQATQDDRQGLGERFFGCVGDFIYLEIEGGVVQEGIRMVAQFWEWSFQVFCCFRWVFWVENSTP